jgi:hypothetical protein
VTDRPDDELGEVSRAELLEAESLARALEARVARNVPDDALETAVLLRVLGDGQLPGDRAAALESEILDSVRPRPRARRVLLSSLSAALGLATLVLVLWLDQRSTLLARLPEPSVDLIAAQAAHLSGTPGSEYPRQMAAYRQAVWAALRADTGGAP